ncbi:MAG: ribosome biogenesis GTPase Der [Verrucomicrobiota bacterium]
MKPTLAIVGRPNVGKSALFNRICGKKIALVYDRPGVTRDRMTMDSCWNDKEFTIIDTGGIGLEDESGFEDEIEHEVGVAMNMATDILFVVDGREGLNPVDQAVAQKLRRSKQRIYLVVNKIDTSKQLGDETEFYRLGFDHIFPVSAAHGVGVHEMMQEVTKDWSAFKESKPEQMELRVALVGRPNVGKSSLVNAVMNEERVIVSPIAGTTRDAVDVAMTYEEKNICFVDTAGMRRRTRVKDPLEQAMSGRSAHSINRAHICVLVLDSAQGVADQEKKIAGLIRDAHKPCIIVVNKWDLAVKALKSEAELQRNAEERDGLKPRPLPTVKKIKQDYEEALRNELFFLPYAPVLFLSAADRKNLKPFLNALLEVDVNRSVDLSTGELNRIMRQAFEAHHPARKTQGRRTRSLKLYYCSQLKEEHRTPTITLFVNDTDLLSDDYQRYLENFLRQRYPLTGCPIKWIIKSRRGDEKIA